MSGRPVCRSPDYLKKLLLARLEKIEIAHLPDALAEARIALHLTDRSRPLICFGNVDLVDFLIRTADSAALRLVPEWARQAHRLNDRSTDLVRTMRMFAECNLRVKHTARRLRVLSSPEELRGAAPGPNDRTRRNTRSSGHHKHELDALTPRAKARGPPR